MKQVTTQRLTKMALALTIAGYCSVPAALAADKVSKVSNLKGGSGWLTSGNTGSIVGTVPKIKLPEGPVTDDGLHVKVEIDRSGRTGGTTATTDGEKQLHVGDKLTVSWDINDTEGDTDATGLTKKSIKWMCYKDQSKKDGRTLQGNGTNGSDAYTIVAADENCYIGLQITPATETGDPRTGVLVDMADLSTAAGGGSDSDDIPEGPVVDDDLQVTIYDAADTTVNLLKNTSVPLHTGHTYKVKLWRDTNGNGTYDSGTDTDVTSYYDYMWVFTGTSATANTSGDSSVQNEDLVLPATNTAATGVLSGAGVDGVQGNTLAIKYKRK